MYNYDHGGDIYGGKDEILDFSVNVNPLGMPASVKLAAAEAIKDCASYPDHSCRRLRRAIAERYGTDPEAVVCGNGASDLIYRLFAALRPKATLLAAPTFSEYEKAALSFGGEVRRHALSESASFGLTEGILDRLAADVDLLFLCNPNNPTGRLIERKLLSKILDGCADYGIFLALDECFLELSEGWADSLIGRIEGNEKLFILRAFTKDYAMPGLRLGYGFCSDKGLLEKMGGAGQPWSVSVPAEAAGIAACGEAGFLKASREYIRRERERLAAALSGLGLGVVGSEANFILFRAPGVKDLKERLLGRGLLIRSSAGFFGLTDEHYRVAVRREADNARLIKALREELRG